MRLKGKSANAGDMSKSGQPAPPAQPQASTHSGSGVSKVRLKSALGQAVEAHFLSGAGERLFATRDPTGVEGAASVIEDKNLIIKSAAAPSAPHSRLATAGIGVLTDIILRSAGTTLLKAVPEHVITAWVALYTPPDKRTTLANVLRACIEYPPNPEVCVLKSEIKICAIVPTTAPQHQKNSGGIFGKLFKLSSKKTQNTHAKQTHNPPIGMRCEERITFKVDDVDNKAVVENVIVTMRYDLVAVRNTGGTDDVELRDLSFTATSASKGSTCEWQAGIGCKRVFLFTELKLIEHESRSEAADALDNAVTRSGGEGGFEQTRTYKQRLQAFLDAQDMQRRAQDMHARIAITPISSSRRKQILFKDAEFLKSNEDICKHIFVSPHQDAEEMLGKFVHTVIADGCADTRNTKPEYFQKISFKVPLDVGDEQEERYKVIEHGSVHIPLSEHNIHALLSYTVTKKLIAAGTAQRSEVAISEAKLGVRHVPVGFKLHNCAWVRYRSTDFIIFTIPNVTHTCVASTLPNCWHQAKEYRTLVSPHPKRVDAALLRGKAAQSEYHTRAVMTQPEQSVAQKPWVTKEPGLRSETKEHLEKHGADHAPGEGVSARDTTDSAELVRDKESEHSPQRKEKHLWADKMVAQASAHSINTINTGEHSFESYVTGFVEAHNKQPQATDGRVRRRPEDASGDSGVRQGFFDANVISREPEKLQSDSESGQSAKEKIARHKSGRPQTKKPLPHPKEKPRSPLLRVLLAVWESILLILKFLIVTPLVCLYKLFDRYATQSVTTEVDAPKEVGGSPAKEPATAKQQKERSALFSKFPQLVKGPFTTNKSDTAVPEQEKQKRSNKGPDGSATSNAPSKVSNEERVQPHSTEHASAQRDTQTNDAMRAGTTKGDADTPSDHEAKVSSVLQEPKIENAFFELHSALYPA
ncbi:hypothetical protein [Anaplasma centrale]|uniref:hypothetical protein n=1 Tax=Anaplasma centrale TaxID=769 RepID=UPI001EE5CB74|nr:hypothetical protein [Anaplasma centrale]